MSAPAKMIRLTGQYGSLLWVRADAIAVVEGFPKDEARCRVELISGERWLVREPYDTVLSLWLLALGGVVLEP